ncbi:MAG: sensor histidine kinase [Sphingomonas sp.]|nr:sensor histidine kinase [Sphingomonas sp.]
MLRDSWALETERLKSRRAWTETDFLPAALEVVETPPNPLGRVILWALVAFLIQNLCMRLAPEAAAAGVELHFRADQSFTVKLPAILLEEMVSNLIENAVRYGCAGGEVTVELKRAPDRDIIAISDTGPDIPVEHQPLATQRFFRLPRDQHLSGSGLGLSIASTLAHRAGGKIEFVSRTSSQPFTVLIAIPSAE